METQTKQYSIITYHKYAIIKMQNSYYSSVDNKKSHFNFNWFDEWYKQ